MGLHGRTRNRGLAIQIMLCNTWGHSSKQKLAPKLPPAGSPHPNRGNYVATIAYMGPKIPKNVRVRQESRAAYRQDQRLAKRRKNATRIHKGYMHYLSQALRSMLYSR